MEAKKYTFEYVIQTMTFYSEGHVSVWARNEEDARERARDKVARDSLVGRYCVRIDDLVSVQ